MKSSKTQQFAKFYLKDIKSHITYDEFDKKTLDELKLSSSDTYK